MKKVLFVCDGKNFSTGAFDFIKSLNETEKILLTGIIFLSIDYRILIPTSIYPDFAPLASLVEDENENVENTIKVFKEDCVKNGIEYRLHEAGQSWNVIDLVKESRFSDLLVISEEMFFKNWGGEQPNHFMRQVMHYAECPVMVIPENYIPIEKIMIAYDGKRQSLFALKLFSLLFPAFSNLQTTIIYIKNEENENIPDIEYLEEYTSRHFPNLNIEKLHASASKNLSDSIQLGKDTLLVTGAFSRSALSNLLKESFVEKTIERHSVPVFIAHSS
ncbi:universal stress protein [Segetibacter koreensis]|uniref:universal stress protein n=1 Tax=Segetibacter koreensis TaxID=398037 RepID=UPI0003617502|nr:universal stress protein [Segetibacter koreensis]